jgi:hypothetical protein
MRFIEECPRTGSAWLKHFHCFCREDKEHDREECERACLQACLEQLKQQPEGMCGRK